jgi:hypothetical protein
LVHLIRFAPNHVFLLAFLGKLPGNPSTLVVHRPELNRFDAWLGHNAVPLVVAAE